MRRTHPTLLVVSALLLAVPAAGAEPPAGDAPPEDPKVKATAFALRQPEIEEATMVEVMRAVEAGLKKNPRLEMKDLDTRLSEYAQETPTDQIESARGALKDGQTALNDLRIPDAVQKLEQAVAGLAGVLPYIKKQELADAQATLAVARFQSGDKKGGREMFVELLTWRPDYTFDPSRIPADLGGEFDEAQKQVEKARKAQIAIVSDPPGAQAYVDGKYIGVTPCTADGQPVGKHYITLKREGYKKAVSPVVVAKKGNSAASVSLDRNEKYLLVEQTRAKVVRTLGQDQIDSEAENLKMVLFIDHAVFVKASAEGSAVGTVGIDAWLYDLRSRRKLSQVHQVVKRDAPFDQQLASLAQNLYTNVSYDGELAAPVDAPPPPSNIKPFYKTWWFWTAIGAGVVVAGGAVGAYYGVTAAADQSCPGEANCFRFQP